MFDPYEWDYNVQPKDLTAFRKYGEHVSSCMENKIYPCNSCGLQRCCGGINRAFNNATMGEMIDPIQCELTDFWHYRQDNKLTLTGGKI
jgi:hypothetical protein